MEYKFKVGDRVCNSDEEEYFEGTVVGYSNTVDSEFPYLIEGEDLRWDFFEFDDDLLSVYESASDMRYYAWARDSELQLISPASKYDLKRTTFLEGVEL